jgi:restriction system protein
MERAAAQADRARARRHREVERLERQREREQRADEKERQRLFHEHKEEEAEAHNRDLTETIEALGNLLQDALGLDCRLNFEALKTPLKMPEFEPKALGQVERAPEAKSYRPKPLGLIRRMIPGMKARYVRILKESQVKFDGEVGAYEEREKTRREAFQAARSRHEEKIKKLREKIAHQHAAIDAVKMDYEAGKENGVRLYCEAVLSHQSYPDGWPESFRVAFMSESKQLVVEYDFPDSTSPQR